MADEITVAQKDATPTPMGKVWLIVLGTMLVSGSMTWAWHIHTITVAHEENLREQEAIRARIIGLQTYRDILRSEGVTGAEAYLFGGTSTHDQVRDSDAHETPELM